MIPRYSRPEMVAIWEPQSRFRIWFEIEAHACDALAELGVIPKEAATTIWEKGGAATFDIARIDANPSIAGPLPARGSVDVGAPAVDSVDSIAWGVNKIKAPQVWAGS